MENAEERMPVHSPFPVKSFSARAGFQIRFA